VLSFTLHIIVVTSSLRRGVLLFLLSSVFGVQHLFFYCLLGSDLVASRQTAPPLLFGWPAILFAPISLDSSTVAVWVAVFELGCPFLLWFVGLSIVRCSSEFWIGFLVRTTPVLVVELFLFIFLCVVSSFYGGCSVGACTSPEVWLSLVLFVSFVQFLFFSPSIFVFIFNKLVVFVSGAIWRQYCCGSLKVYVSSTSSCVVRCCSKGFSA